MIDRKLRIMQPNPESYIESRNENPAVKLKRQYGATYQQKNLCNQEDLDQIKLGYDLGLKDAIPVSNKGDIIHPDVSEDGFCTIGSVPCYGHITEVINKISSAPIYIEPDEEKFMSFLAELGKLTPYIDHKLSAAQNDMNFTEELSMDSIATLKADFKRSMKGNPKKMHLLAPIKENASATIGLPIRRKHANSNQDPLKRHSSEYDEAYLKTPILSYRTEIRNKWPEYDPAPREKADNFEHLQRGGAPDSIPAFKNYVKPHLYVNNYEQSGEVDELPSLNDLDLEIAVSKMANDKFVRNFQDEPKSFSSQFRDDHRPRHLDLDSDFRSPTKHKSWIDPSYKSRLGNYLKGPIFSEDEDQSQFENQARFKFEDQEPFKYEDQFQFGDQERFQYDERRHGELVELTNRLLIVCD